jgi:hypothetical protein
MLEPLLRDGGWVFHDFQAGKFNIDHILEQLGSRLGAIGVEQLGSRLEC